MPDRRAPDQMQMVRMIGMSCASTPEKQQRYYIVGEGVSEMTTKRAGSASFLLVAMVAAGIGASCPALATKSSSWIVEPGTTYLGQSYNRLAGEWWNWASKEPSATNPVLDTTGKNCQRNQKGSVWFLAGTFFADPVMRNCTIPAGKALFIPIVNGNSFYPEYPEPDNRCTLSGRFDLTKQAGRLSGVRCDVNDDQVSGDDKNDVVYNFVNLKFTVDDLSTRAQPDLRIADPYGYRAQTPPGGYTQYIPSGSLFTEKEWGELSPGPRFPAVADGYWVFLKPLPAGRYRIRIHADARSGGAALDVTYNLTVAP